MGFDSIRFVHKVDDEIICSLCSCVFDEPIMINECEHIFCFSCIQKWLKHKEVCPIDSRIMTRSDILPAPKVIINILKKLEIKCDYEHLGCPSVVTLDQLILHAESCLYNPVQRECEKGCGKLMARKEFKTHSCAIEDVMKTLKQTMQKIKELEIKLEKFDTTKELKDTEIDLGDTRKVLKDSFEDVINHLSDTRKELEDARNEYRTTEKELKDSFEDVKKQLHDIRNEVGASAPAGTIAFFASNTTPAGWLKADGAIVSRKMYTNLFTAIGTTFGSGDGSNTFNLPDLRGEFIRGWSDKREVDEGRAFGSFQWGSNIPMAGYVGGTYTRSIADGYKDNWSFAGSTFDDGMEKNIPPGETRGGTTFPQHVNTDYIDKKGNAAITSWNVWKGTRPRNIALLALIKC